jgi:hypothetical protein
MASKEIIIIQGRPVGLFLGSGASFPYPSELPTFKHILEEWLSNIGKFGSFSFQMGKFLFAFPL